MTMIVGLCSTYREGTLGMSAILSARAACDATIVYEGPVGEPPFPPTTPQQGAEVTALRALCKLRGIDFVSSEWVSDAVKRQALLERAKAVHANVTRKRYAGELWVVWVDGDELLLWGQYLREHLEHVERDPSAFNWLMRLVEVDGSTAHCSGKVLRAAMVDEYLDSSYQVRFAGGTILALPNVPLTGPGGRPWAGDDTNPYNRPPLAGEPHLLHRSYLRDPERAATRLHETEQEFFEGAPDA